MGGTGGDDFLGILLFRKCLGGGAQAEGAGEVGEEGEAGFRVMSSCEKFVQEEVRARTKRMSGEEKRLSKIWIGWKESLGRWFFGRRGCGIIV